MDQDQREIFRQTLTRIDIQRSKAPGHLLQSNPSSSAAGWNDRYWNCFEPGHSFPFCPLPLHCSTCNQLDHIHSLCPTVAFQDPMVDPLIPQAHTNPADFPTNRPEHSHIHIPMDSLMKGDLTRFVRCVVVDAQLSPQFDRDSIYRFLNEAREWEGKIQVAHWRDHKFILSLPTEVDSASFVEKPPQCLSDKGLIIYQWSFKDGAIESPYRFLVWIDFLGLPNVTWRSDKLRLITSSFGLLKDHGPVSFLVSIVRHRAVVQVQNLQHVPRIYRAKY